jgi:segregation and condensation protein B
MNNKQLYHIIEGITLIMGEDGISMDKLNTICNIDNAKIKQIIDQQKELIMQDESRAGYVTYIKDLVLFKLKDEYNTIYQSLKTGKPPRLTDINIEVLTIIAYEQPVSKSKINFIRGINSDNSVQKLLNLKLIKKAGVDEENFNATLYKTTSKFLDYMQISSLKDLPDYQEIEKEVESEN